MVQFYSLSEALENPGFELREIREEVGMGILIKGGKVLTLLFWLSELANLFQLMPAPLDKMLHIAAVALLALHGVEVALFTRLHGQQLVEPKYHKMQILVFGIFHWLDLLQRQHIRLSKPGA